MSRDTSIVVISSESDSDNECHSNSENSNDEFSSIIELIDLDNDTAEDDDDDDVEIISTGHDARPAQATVLETAAAAAAATIKTDSDSECTIVVDKQKYFAPKNGLLSPWRRCQIVSENNTTYNVQFCDDGDCCAFPGYQIALSNAPQKQLLSGTRVIAAQILKENVKYFYAGVIGETIRRSNDYHYLIFFDNGRVLYMHPSRVREVKENDKWLHVHANAKRFMQYCFEGSEIREERVVPIVPNTLGARMHVECDRKWQFGKIVNTRGDSLILIEYEGIKRAEWLYRGSPRLGPIWRKYMKVPEVNHEISLIETYSSLESDSEDDSEESTHETPSTSANYVMDKRKESTNRFKQLKPETMKEYRAPLEYKTHDCSSRCSAFDAKGANLNKYGPLALPMIMGWTRSASKRRVWYEAPCGKVMRNIHDLRRYLQATKCKLLDVDNFCYETQVDCMRGYESNERHILSKDLSNGIEVRPIRVTNAYNKKMPDKFTYVSEMCLNRSVPNYAANVESMSCCDCPDDCYDRFECPCWQLTMAGLPYTNTSMDHYGYQYKRLDCVISTAIFECNVNCKCSKKCSNRVAQMPISHNLELFKTKNCGWGVRCRNDLPTGAFICCYFGDLMTEEHVEHVAKKYGDNYLAQLNFIEVGEEVKEGYEAYARMSPSSLSVQSERDFDKNIEQPPAKKARTSNTNETLSVISNAGSSSTDSGNANMNEPVVTVINYFPRMETTTECHPTRRLFGRTEYIIDGKRCGNIGRFFNHSCEPNMFLQNVFIDTHDLRFPRLALFTSKPIVAGSELLWDYNYIVGSIANRQIKCECGAKHCRGRLL